MNTIYKLLSLLFFYFFSCLPLSAQSKKLQIAFNNLNADPVISYCGKKLSIDTTLSKDSSIDVIEISNIIKATDLFVILVDSENNYLKDSVMFKLDANDITLDLQLIKGGRLNAIPPGVFATHHNSQAWKVKFPLHIEYRYTGFNRIPNSFDIKTATASSPVASAIPVKKQKGVTRFDFLFDEDFLLELIGLKRYNKDRDYSGGFAFVFSGPFAKKVFIMSPIHNFLDRVCFINVQKKNNYQKYDFAHPYCNLKFGGSTFTPIGDSLKESNPVIGDRPYASLNFIGHTNMYLTNDSTSSISTDFVFGVLGLNIMSEMQTSIHRLNKNGFNPFGNEPDPTNIIKPFYPQGWQNQISNGGEPTFLYGFTGRQQKCKVRNKCVKDSAAVLFDLVQMESVNMGYYNNLRYGATLRYGKIKQHWSMFSSSPTGSIQAQANDTAKKYYNQYYLFLSARLNVVIYNALMEGQFKHSNYTLDDSEINHVIAEGEFGAVLQPCKHCAFTFTLAGRTVDFKTSTNKKTHLWACIYYTWFLN